MGLIKRDGYVFKGVELRPAYAKIVTLEANTNGNQENEENILRVVFGISTLRENLDRGDILTYENFICPFDRSKDELFNQAYTAAKQSLFEGWEDDIIQNTEEEEN